MTIVINDDGSVTVTKTNGDFFNLIHDPETLKPFTSVEEATACANKFAENPFVWVTPEPEEPTE